MVRTGDARTQCLRRVLSRALVNRGAWDADERQATAFLRARLLRAVADRLLLLEELL